MGGGFDPRFACTARVETRRVIGVPSLDTPSMLYSDSQGCLSITKDPPENHARMKHVDIRYHFIWHLICSGNMVIQLTHTGKERC